MTLVWWILHTAADYSMEISERDKYSAHILYQLPDPQNAIFPNIFCKKKVYFILQYTLFFLTFMTPFKNWKKEVFMEQSACLVAFIKSNIRDWIWFSPTLKFLTPKHYRFSWFKHDSYSKQKLNQF